jgi:multidrug efflux pump subunit AcrB
VFIPVGFLGGIAGALYRQFAITVAIAVAISGLVALTLSPALCALVLREHREPRGFFRAFNTWFEAGTNRFVRLVRFLLGHSALGAVLFLTVVLAAAFLFRLVPGGLVPEEDQGYFIAAALLPEGATLHRTHEVAERVEKMLMADKAIEHVATINGIDFVGGGTKSSSSTMFIMLKKWDERKSPELSLNSTILRFFQNTGSIQEAFVIGFNPPPIQGLGTTGGFEAYVQSRGEADTARLNEVTQGFLAKLREDKRLLGVQTLFRADSPQINLSLDREKAKSLGVSVDSVFTTLQANFGTLYVNDFDRAGRSSGSSCRPSPPSAPGRRT